MFSPEALTFFTIFIYILASAFGIAGLILRHKRLHKLGWLFALAAFTCQTLFLIFGFHRALPDGLTFGAYLQLIAWFFLLAGIGVWLRLRQVSILIFSSPLSLLLFLLSVPWLNLQLQLPQSLSASFFTLHVGSLFASLGLLTLAFVAAILFLILNDRIKSKKRMKGIWGNIPALSTLENIISFCALACYPLYTIGLAAGLLWAPMVFGSSLYRDPKGILSIIIWLLLTRLFYEKTVQNMKGRRPAILIVVIFSLSIFSIIGVNVFLPTSHSFIN